MAEVSFLWQTNGTGDGTDTGYTQTQMFEWLRSFLTPSATNLGGVAPDYQNKLAVSGTSSPVSVATGAALVYGIPYVNTAAVNVAIPTPSGATRIDRIVLRADYTAQTVRITRIAGTEGGAGPSLTQSAGTTWDIPLAQVSITTAGVVTVTDQREWLSLVGDGAVTTAKLAADAVTGAKIADDTIGTEHYIFASVDSNAIGGFAVGTGHINPGAVNASKLASDAVETAKIKDANVTETKLGTGAVTETKLGTGAVTTTKLGDDSVTAAKVGTQVPALVNRRGGSATDWSASGTTNYTAGNVRIECGAHFYDHPGSGTTGELITITFPVAFSQPPLVVFSIAEMGLSGMEFHNVHVYDVTASAVTIRYELYISSPVNDFVINWIAIGPE